MVKVILVMSVVLLLVLAYFNFGEALGEIGRNHWSDANSDVIREHDAFNIKLFTPTFICLIVAFLCVWELCKLPRGE